MESEMIIGIGDLHGHYPALEGLLSALDNKYNLFSEGKIRESIKMIFTGDYIDRGFFNLKTLDRVISLSECPNVITLFGNHELMALASLDIARNIVQHNKNPDNYLLSLHGMNGGLEILRELDSNPNNALKKYVAMMDKSERVGKWIRNLKPFTLENFHNERILFAHGGIPDIFEEPNDLDSYSTYFREKVDRDTAKCGGYMKKYFETTRLGPHSIFWDRQMINQSQEQLTKRLKNLNLTRVVVGHTPHRDIFNYHNLCFDIDVGMTPRCGGNKPAALLFKSTGIYSFYSDGSEKTLVSF